MASPIKKVFIFILLAAIGGLVYVYFFQGEKVQPSASGLSSSTGRTVGAQGLGGESQGSGSDIGREFLTSLLNLKTLTLSDKLFTNDSFSTLEDFSVVIIPPTDTGRPNPFAPVSSGIESTVDTLSIPPLGSLIETLPPVN
jgi:hypothetical protein